MPDPPWYRANPAALETATESILAVQPGLRMVDNGNGVVFRGRFDIRERGEIVEAFAVEIAPNGNSALDIPVVWEIGGRVPRVMDPHHVNVNDGSLCVVLPEAFWYEYPEGLFLPDYIEGPLRRHLAGQAMVLRGRPWPVGEWAHGLRATGEFYGELFGTEDPTHLRGFFDLLTCQEVKTHWICPCGSGKKLRHCHKEQVYRVRRRVPEALLDPLRSYLGKSGKLKPKNNSR